MTRSPYALAIVLTLLVSACGTGNGNQEAGTKSPIFFTPTIPATPTLAHTATPLPPTPIPTFPPIEGMTTTQVNVRAETSTNSAVLGMIPQATSVQVIGKDASGTWVQLSYPQSPQGKGWVLAAYVQVAVGAEVPVIAVGSGSGAVGTALVVQQVNVRSGPGVQFYSLGTLNPNDVAAVTGKDPSGAWLQIEFTGAPDGRGWVNTEFIQATGTESLPVVGEAAEAPQDETPEAAQVPGTTTPAIQDEDSESAPLASVSFSPAGARALQFYGDVSAPPGDSEDWIQFTPYGERVAVRITCIGGEAVEAQILRTSEPILAIACGDRRTVIVEAGQEYLMRVRTMAEAGPGRIPYILKIEQVLQ